MLSIKNPELLNITGPDGNIFTGGNQEWYETQWHKMAGCGPVAASNLVWYYARSKNTALCDVGSGGQSDFLKLMDTMYTYITPGRRGIHSSRLFIPGLLAFFSDRGFKIKTDCLEIPRMPRSAPTRDTVRDYLMHWLEKDCPVAFLNLSNGTLELPDSWHWVTVLALEPQDMTALISDEGRTYEARVGRWVETSFLGGAFVTIH